MTDAQAEALGPFEGLLLLDSLTSFSDEQAESLGHVKSFALAGLTSITDAQAESLQVLRVWNYAVWPPSLTQKREA